MSEPTVVDARLDKIERDNRRLKLTVGALLLVLAAVPLIGAVMPEQIPQVITAREFSVVDENGTERAVMEPLGIGYYDENGSARVRMFADGIHYWDENETIRAWIDEIGIGYADENGTVRASINDLGII